MDYLPQRIAARREKHGPFEVFRMPFLYTGIQPEDDPLVEILVSRVRETITNENLKHPKVALLDHGSPLPSVTAVRDALAHRLADMLGNEVSAVCPASMERRAGEA